MADTWHRYDDVRYAPPSDADGDCYGPGRMEVVLRTYQVTKTTPKGVWLDFKYKFVLLSSRKQFACPTIEAARLSFIARKTRQARIYRARLAQAEEALAIATGESAFAKIRGCEPEGLPL